jgi:hypothetical protein
MEDRIVSYEFAKYNKLIPSSLDFAFKAVEGLSILSKGTDVLFEKMYQESEKNNIEKYCFDKELLLVNLDQLNK